MVAMGDVGAAESVRGYIAPVAVIFMPSTGRDCAAKHANTACSIAALRAKCTSFAIFNPTSQHAQANALYVVVAAFFQNQIGPFAGGQDVFLQIDFVDLAPNALGRASGLAVV